MEKVLVDGVVSVPAGTDVAALPERVQEALGELAGAAKEGCSPSRSASGWASWPS